MKRTASSQFKAPRQAKRQRSSTIPRAYKQDYRLYSAVKQEFKCWDIQFGSAMTTTGVVTNLATAATPSALIRGSDYLNNFIGQNLNIVGVQCKWNLNGAESNVFAGADLNNTSRMMLFQWNDSTGPSMSGLLQNTSTPWISPVYLTNRENINVLHDELRSTHMTVYNSNSSYASSNGHSGKFYVKGKKFGPVQMDVGANTYQKGGLYFMVCSDSSITPNPTFSAYIRITFVD